MRIAVGFATRGRRKTIGQTLASLRAQSRAPDHVFVSITSHEDIDEGDLQPFDCPTTVVENHKPGLCIQRNAILDRCSNFDLLLFFDDDFIIERDYIRVMERLFSAEQRIQMAIGTLILDGATGPGFTSAHAEAVIRSFKKQAQGVRDVFSAYGCNMAIRLRTVFQHGLRFDERLPLHGLLEDLSFSRTICHFGRIVQTTEAVGVHLGDKHGRVSGRRYGYSQVANPIYLRHRRLISLPTAALFVCKNLLANAMRSMLPEAWIDRRGRLAGNLVALRDLLNGKLDPLRILDEL
ncbi:GT2 family glycosyltransferase [Bradyrhizobium sp. USDA 372]